MQSDPVEAATFRKLAWPVMPLLTPGFILNILACRNIDVAAFQYHREMGLSSAQLGFSVGIIAYSVCEVPVNLLLYRFGLSCWLGRVMIAWGAVAILGGLVNPWGEFYPLEVLLGLAAGGFVPGVVLLISIFFPVENRAGMMALFLLGAPIANVVVGPLSAALPSLDQVAGLAGWQWLAIIESLPSVLLGLAVLTLLPDRPAEASWLTVEERILAEDRLASESRQGEITQFWAALKDDRVLTLSLIQFGFMVPAFGLATLLPQMIKVALPSDPTVGLLIALPFATAGVVMLIWARRVDRSGQDVDDVGLACAVATAGLLLSLISEPFWLSFLCLTVALVGIIAVQPIFWAIPPRFLTGIAAAGAFGFIHSVGMLGGFVGRAVVRWLTATTGSFSAGVAALSAFALLASILAYAIRPRVPRV